MSYGPKYQLVTFRGNEAVVKESNQYEKLSDLPQLYNPDVVVESDSGIIHDKDRTLFHIGDKLIAFIKRIS